MESKGTWFFWFGGIAIAIAVILIFSELFVINGEKQSQQQTQTTQNNPQLNESPVTKIVVRSTRLLAVVLLLMALAKYFHGLGKSFMHEAIVSSERRHALNFGGYFLNAFPDPGNYKERKDIFADWNKERNSGFHTLKTEEIDPKIIEAITAITSAVKVNDKQEEQKKS